MATTTFSSAALSSASPARSTSQMASSGLAKDPEQHVPASSWNVGSGNGRVNVGETERMASLIGGGLLAMHGLTRGSMTGLALAAIGGSLVYRGVSGHCQMYEALGMNSATHNRQTSIPAKQGVKFEESITVQKSREELYRFWRNFENLPQVMRHLESVKDLGGGRSHWVAKGPTGLVEWDAEIITERPNEMISWRSLEESDVQTSGSVHFKPATGNRGTEVKVSLRYNPPAGRIGAAIAWLVGQDPEQQVREDLRTFKRVMECGSAATTQGQPRGTCSWSGS